jgi:hypothetical protein
MKIQPGNKYVDQIRIGKGWRCWGYYSSVGAGWYYRIESYEERQVFLKIWG